MRDGRHDFDFFFGSWQQENRKRVKPLVPDDDEWVEFESFSEARPDPRRARERRHVQRAAVPGPPRLRGVLAPALRARDRPLADLGLNRGQRPHRPTVLGRFDDGIGPAVWEQSFSFDDGATWDANCTTRHARVA